MTGKQRRFAMALAAGRDKLEAAKIAGYTGASARVTAYRLSRDSRILAEVARIREGQPRPAHEVRTDLDPVEFLASFMNDNSQETEARMRAAIALLRVRDVTPVARQGVKIAADARAKAAASRIPTRDLPHSVIQFPLRRPSGDDAT